MRRLLGIVFLISIFTTRISAQEIIDTTKKTALGVNPAIMEVVLSEKEPSEREIILYNLTNFPIPIKTTAESFTPKEKLEIPKEKLKRFDASSWIEIGKDDKDFILQARETRKVKIKIVSPKDASPGGHYASLVFEPLIPQQLVSKESVYIFARVATLIFMQVKGDVVENLSVKGVPLKTLYQSLPEKFSLILKNDGNTHLRPTGKLVFYDEIRKKPIGQLTFFPSIILPDTEKEYPMETEGNLKLIVGKYSLKGEVSYGVNNNYIKTDKYYFWVFPYGLSIIIIITFIIFITIITRWRTRITKALKIVILGERYDRIEKRREMEALERIKIKRLSNTRRV